MKNSVSTAVLSGDFNIACLAFYLKLGVRKNIIFVLVLY